MNDDSKNLNGLDTLQIEIESWRADNFGPKSESFKSVRRFMDQDNNAMMITQLLGMNEEIGELTHAVLKKMQGIRGMDDPLTFKTAAMDAIGDIFIYAMGLCDTLNLDMSDCLDKTAESVLKRDWNANKESGETDEKKVPRMEFKPLNLEKDPKLDKMKDDLTDNLMKIDQISRIFESGKFSLEQFMVYLCTSAAMQLMTGERNDDYNDGGVEIKDYWDNLDESFQMVKVKFLRTKSLTAKISKDQKVKAMLKLADSCIDLINYASFHIANAMRQNEQEYLFSEIINKYQCHNTLLKLIKGGDENGDDN